MLKLYESFQKTKVLSLRVGGAVAEVVEPIINPNNLYIEGWYVQDSHSREQLILLSKDIREILPQGIAINDHEVLSTEDELVRLQEILQLNFRIPGLKVMSESGKNYGKATDFAFDTDNLFVQKIYASQPVLRNFAGGNLSIDRSQILEITTKRIVIEDPTVPAEKPAVQSVPVSS